MGHADHTLYAEDHHVTLSETLLVQCIFAKSLL